MDTHVCYHSWPFTFVAFSYTEKQIKWTSIPLITRNWESNRHVDGLLILFKGVVDNGGMAISIG